MSALESFSSPTREWFRASFPAPTPAQEGAWAAVSQGHHALVVAPTGSGKTLSAFLSALDALISTPPEQAPAKERRCRVLYVSPLKALAVDVERNLRAPLIGITRTAERLGITVPDVRVGIRSGDTPPAERRKQATHPPDILITTPESLFLLLTSKGREALRGVETVILDEVHAVAGTKRGAHLAISLERLDALLDKPAQRIGLSATVRPIETVAAFLGGDAPVDVVAPTSTKNWELSVVVPVEDMTAPSPRELPQAPSTDDPFGADYDPDASRRAASIWPHVEEHVVDLVEQHRSTIVFANSRRLSERLTARLNEIATRRAGIAISSDPVPPAELLAASGSSLGADGDGAVIIAKAHHGSVSKEQRGLIEDDLKQGRIPCVVATSSLELGIDMGAVDLVIQIESPPSVASALQRVGRAGHQVGETSRGVLMPKHRGDLAQTAVAVDRMRTGGIESLRVPTNPLDVLAQQIVAATALDDWDVDELFALVRRSAPYRTLPRPAWEATLDLLSGRYPSEEFAELRPRIVWDRVEGTIAARPGAQRLAVTSGGTIPDRGLFGVHLVGEGSGRRVGELDEEMVYESRVGDVFALGASSWRIEDITPDRVMVTPAPGVLGRLPFWKGDSPGRPAELGAAVGALHRTLAAASPGEAEKSVRALGLDEYAAANLVRYVEEQKEATNLVPTDRQIVVERFRDELGDWRLIVHSPYGTPVHAPWALALNARLRERYGVEAQAMASDDGIVIRLPDSDEEPPGADVVVFEPDEIEQIVTQEVGGSALFASRFRECAARALLLPRRNPGRRSPLWQQRQRSAQLLEVAVKYPSFPIVLEAVRECLQDVYDLPSLVSLLTAVQRREISVVEVSTPSPSPFAGNLLFGYVAQFLYEGDSPLAERRAAALSLDQSLLAQLLGRAELRDLLDPDVLAQVESELQWLADDRLAKDAEAVVDMLRLLGPLSTTEVSARSRDPESVAPWLKDLHASRRIFPVRVQGVELWSTVEDVARLRDGLGVPVPIGVPTAFTQEVVVDPVGDLVARHARTHGPFGVAEIAARFALGEAVVRQAVERLTSRGRLVEGEFRPGAHGQEWCDADVLRRLRRRSLAKLRQEVEPVPPAALGRFLPVWQKVAAASTGRRGGVRGIDGVMEVVDQLAGCPVPASALEPLILSSRVTDYQSGMLDELTAAGEVLWAGHGALPGNDGWVSLHPGDRAHLTLPTVTQDHEPDDIAQALLEALSDGGAWFFPQLLNRVQALLAASGNERVVGDSALSTALWALVWSGQVSNDTLGPLRGLIRQGSTTHRTRRTPPRTGRMPARSGPPGTAGRWSLLPERDLDPTRRAHAGAEVLLERHGVVTRGAVTGERIPGGFAGVYRVLAALEETGRCRRGYFVEGLGAAQFGPVGAVDRLRTFSELPPAQHEPTVVTLAATDPANPYGAALPWPPGEGHRPGRKAGAVVVLCDGELAAYVERGGKSLLTYATVPTVLTAVANALAETVRRGAWDSLTVERIDGAPVLGSGDTPLRHALVAAGFVVTTKGMKIRARG